MGVRLNAVSRASALKTGEREREKKKRGLSVESMYRYAPIVSLHFRDYAIFAEEQNILTYGLCTRKARCSKGIPPPCGGASSETFCERNRFAQCSISREFLEDWKYIKVHVCF